MEKHKKILSLLPYVLSVCIGIYLTYTVDLTTLETFFEKAFVFIFFTLSVSVLIFLFKRHIGLSFSLKLIACVLLLSLSVILIYRQSFFPKKQHSTITFEAAIEDNATHPQEVWLAEVRLDGKILPISSLNVISNEGWSYIPASDDYVYYPKSNISSENGNRLTVEVFCESAEIHFARNSWSGKVSYALNNSENYSTIELYSGSNDSAASETLFLDLSATNSVKDIIFPAIGATLTVSSFLYMLLSIINKRLAGRKKQSYITKNFISNTFIFSIYLFLVNLFLDILEHKYDYTPEEITLSIGFLLLVLIYPYSSRIIPMFRRFKILETVLLLVIVLIVTFQSTAEILFIGLDKTSVSFTDILTFIIAMIIAAVPILELTLFIDKHTQNRFSEGETIEKE